MDTTTVTSKGQVTIPQEVRRKLGIRKGSKVAFTVVGDDEGIQGVPDAAAGAGSLGSVRGWGYFMHGFWVFKAWWWWLALLDALVAVPYWIFAPALLPRLQRLQEERPGLLKATLYRR